MSTMVVYPLTQAQKRIWYTEQFFPDTGISNLGGFTKLRSDKAIDPVLLIEAFRLVVQSNETLRLRFTVNNDEPAQYVADSVLDEIEWIDASGDGESDRLRDWAEAEMRKPMPLYDSELVKFTVFKISETENWFFVKVHHIISDGISLVMLGNQIANACAKLAKGEEVLSAVQPSYIEYISSEQDYFQSERFQKDKVYWEQKFAELPEPAPLKNVRASRAGIAALRLSRDLPPELHEQIRRFCVETGVSILALFLSVLHIYMYRVTGKRDQVLGTFMGNRTQPREKQMMGMFVSTIPMRCYIDEALDFMTFARQQMKEQLAVIRHQKYPYNLLVSDLRAQHGSADPLFSVSLEYQVMQWQQLENLSIFTEPIFNGSEVNDISLHVKERWDTGSLALDLDYRRDLFTEAEIGDIYERLITLLWDVTTLPNKNIAELAWLPEEHKQRMPNLCNAGGIVYDRGQTLHGLFERRTETDPDRQAVVYEGRSLTYKELNRQANGLGHLLSAKRVGPDTPVLLLMERSERFIVAILGVLKAGYAYVPVDPDFPEERIRHIVEDSGAAFIITDQPLNDRYGLDPERIIEFKAAVAGTENAENPGIDVTARDLAYIIYTSGTTGRPKGVMIEHRQVHHLIEGLHERVYKAYGGGLNIALLAPFHFDASVQQVFASLLLGHTLFIVPRSYASSGKTLMDYYKKQRIEITDGTPAHVQIIAGAGGLEAIPLRHLLIGGEALPYDGVKKLLDKFAAAGVYPQITNVYGPTECCVDAASFDYLPETKEAAGAYVPIGKPLGSNRLYIMDQFGQILPEGVEGELCIAGDGVGRGYLNLSELTAQKFVPDPFVPNGMMYRTGDLARWLPDGNVEFIGRSDDQVKIRGYRIELGEIEAVLHQHPGVDKAVVLARPQGENGYELSAYIVPKETDIPTAPDEWKAHLSKRLPEYMIPPYFAELKEIPLTPSGKVDRKALLKLEVTVASGAEYVAPANETEQQLADIWGEVLGAERVGMLDNFFELGGHSLKAMTLLSRVHKALGVEVPLHILFGTPTVQAVAEYVRQAEETVFASIEPAPPQTFYPLSLAQRRLYIAGQLEQAGIAYNMPAAAWIEGSIDISRLEAAFRKLIRRHESLRTSFETVEGVPVQKIHDNVSFELTVIPANECSPEEAMSSFVRPFDIDHAPLLRVGLMSVEEKRHMLLFDMHHLVSDGVSIAILLRELGYLYGEEGQLPELRLQYKDAAVWQNAKAETIFAAEEDYWLTALGGELPVLELLTDYPRPPVQSFEGDRVSAVLDPAITSELKQLAERNGVTLYMVLLSAYYALLAKYTSQEDIVVGTPTAGRNHADLEGVVGLFVNTLAIRAKINLGDSFNKLLHEVYSQAVEAFEHQSYPFERLVDKLSLPRDLSRNPLFDTVFILQNAMEALPDLGGARLSLYETNFRVAKFDLTLQATEEDDGIRFDLDYATRLFRRETAGRMLKQYVNLLRAAVVDPQMKVGEYSLPGGQEREQLLHGFNPGPTDYPKEENVVWMFERQAATSPDRTALVYEGAQLTYGQLNAKANQLARTLRNRGVGSGEVVALLLERSLEMIVSVMAVLKAGAAYVPMDPEHPGQRIRHFFDDSKASVLLTQRTLAHLAEAVEYEGVILLADDGDLYHGDDTNVDVPIAPDQLANLTYTSGTTGLPKGNMVTHANILRTVCYTNYIDISPEDTFLGLSNYVFDAFMFDVFGSLLHGARLVLVPKDVVLNISQLPRVIKREGVSVLMITTALFNLLVDLAPDCIQSIRKVLFGGERASVDHVRRALAAAGPERLLHMYGPSESTVFATFYPVNEVNDQAVSIPIGKPVSNTAVYILDTFNRPQPIGVAGELCVGGDGIVLGYLNRPELTGEKFTIHPFEDGARIYRTGDLARWLPDGNIEFIGRIDHQVKIRGQRIELGEIEHQLLQHEAVRETAVLALDMAGGEKRLCAYFVAETVLTVSELREHAAKGLPAYMIPSAFIQLDELPLTGNGKIDRRALPAPEEDAAADSDYTAPRNEMEAAVAGIWQAVLDVQRVGIHDNFFDLGGHSLKAMAMLARVHRELEAEIPLRELFASPTAAAFAEVLSRSGKSVFDSIGRAPRQEVYPVSSAQKRLYVLQQMEGAEQSYNMPAVFDLEGPLVQERFNAVIKELVRRHEALRTSFELVDGTPMQRVWEETNFAVEYVQASQKEAAEMLAHLVRPFVLNQAPLFRVTLIRTSEMKHLLFIDMHHIISDGASVDILMDEIARLYVGEELEPLRIQYKDYAVWQQSFFRTEAFRQQEAYWLEQIGKDIPSLQLPTDYVRPAVQTFAGDRIRFALDDMFATVLRRLAQDTGTTLNMVLLACYTTLLGKLSGQNDIVVGTPFVGRPHSDLERLVGMFVNTLPLRLRPEASYTFERYLQEVKEASLGAFEFQDYPLEELITKLQLPRDLSRNPVFDTVFAMQNADLNDLKMDRLSLKPHASEQKTAKFDLTLTAADDGHTIMLEFEYNTALFKYETITRWSGYLVHMMRSIAANRGALLSELPLLTEQEQHVLLEDWNQTDMEVPEDRTVVGLFEEQAERTPEATAVTYGGKTWSYRELNGRANQLARLLRERGAGPERAVGIMVKPSLEMASGVLGIMKTGAAYVPIDPDYPAQRIAYILADSGALALVTQSGLPIPEDYSGTVIYLDGGLSGGSLSGDSLHEGVRFGDVQTGDSLGDDGSPGDHGRHEADLSKDSPSVVSAGWADEPNPPLAAGPHDLAYMIYTSGTTGQPKGVMVEHQSLVNLCCWHNETFGVTAEDRSAKYAGFGFDASVWELFPYWVAGAEIHVIDEGIRMDLESLNRYFETNSVTITFLPTQLCEQFMELENRSLRVLLTGGDKLKRALPPGRSYTLVNNYGPTESTVVATSMTVEAGEAVPAIGKPIANTRVYVLGTGDMPQPIGVPGELCIAGRSLARGYRNRPEETAARFVADPFVPGGVMYRTGDLVKWRSDGRIEYVGRIDQQVKVRGFRIELAEIESRLLSHPEVKEAAVLDVTDKQGQTALCAYVVASESAALDVEGLKRHLAAVLPDYMVPAYWTALAGLPVTANGKLDRRALPQPDTSAGASAYREPASASEALLAEIWQDVLGVERVGTEDNFFALGGDSIKAIQMASRLHKHGWKLEMKDLFRNPTIVQVSPYLEELQGERADQSEVKGEVKPTPVQRWFFEQRFTDRHHWNQSIMLYAEKGFERSRTEAALRALVEHHDALRMVFTETADGVVQYNRGVEGELFTLEEFDYRTGAEGCEVTGPEAWKRAIESEAERLQSGINLSRGPLVKAAMFHTDQGSHLLIVIHHLVVDGVSWRILLEDFASVYKQEDRGEAVMLPAKTHSFAEWSERMHEFAESRLLLQEIAYWSQLEKMCPLPLPKDSETDDRRMQHTVTAEFKLSPEQTLHLTTQAHEAYRTEMNDILLTALGCAVRDWTGFDHVLVNMEGHGREEVIEEIDVSRTVGWFTSQYPFVLDMSHAEDTAYQLKRIKEDLRHIPNKGVGYGILRYVAPDEYKAELDFSLQPEISFNYLGQFSEPANADAFVRSSMPMGSPLGQEGEKPTSLDVVGYIEGGVLCMSIAYNGLEYTSETISALNESFKTHLVRMIDHCMSQEGGEMTPSDLGDDELTIEELDQLMQML
ncbi:amino acid adenylation domain-containing protein [Paenibacillus terrae]